MVVETTIHLAPEEVYEFLLDFERYPAYSTYLQSVDRLDERAGTGAGDVGPGARFALRFAWWRLGYTAHSEVVGVDPPNEIDWTVTKDIDARGRWTIEAVDPPTADAPAADAQTEDAQTEDAQTEDAQTEDAQTEDAQTEDAPTADDSTETRHASRVTLEVRYDPESVGRDVVDLPPLVSFSWLVERVQGLVLREGQHVVERIVADLEGEPRDVDLRVTVDGEREL